MFIPCRDLAGKVARPCLIYRRNWSQTSKSLIWTFAPWNQACISALSKMQCNKTRYFYYIWNVGRSICERRKYRDLWLSTLQIRSRITHWRMEVVNVSMPSQASKSLSWIICHRLLAMVFNNSGWECSVEVISHFYRPPLTPTSCFKFLLGALSMHYSWTWILWCLET